MAENPSRWPPSTSYVERTWPEFFSYAVKVAGRAGVGNEADAELVAAEACLRFFASTEPIEKAKPWLKTVAKRLAVDFHRAETKHAHAPLLAAETGDSDPPPDDGIADPHQHVSAVPRHVEMLEEVLALFDSAQQDMLLVWAAGGTNEEIAAASGGKYSAASVPSIISKMRKRIKTELELDLD